MNVEALQDSWDRVAEVGDPAIVYFYDHLFTSHPEVRGLFPADMGPQRARFFEGLGTIVASVTLLAEDPSYVQQLGRRHHGYSVVAEQYPAAGASLLATLEHFLGAGFTEELRATWTEAFEVVAGIMIEAQAEVAGV